MRVLHLGATDIRGGAARSAYRLHRSLLEAGCDSRMGVGLKESDDNTVCLLPHSLSWRSLKGRIRFELQERRLFRAKARANERTIFTLSEAPWEHSRIPEHNIIHAHWMRHFVSFRELVSIMTKCAGAVWTIHDINSFSGGCHFPGDCSGYERMCGNCPKLGALKELDLSRKDAARKKRLLGQIEPSRLKIVAPSNWIAEAARSSLVLHGFEVLVIPYGIDTERYKPRSSAEIRSSLGIRERDRVVLSMAARLSDPRKGGSAFYDAIARADLFKDGSAILVSIGSDCPDLPPSIRHVKIGKVTDEDRLAGLIGMADCLLMPTLDDNLPNAGLEAISCGVPVVSYKTGGMPDIIGDNDAGRLVPKGDVLSLLDAAKALLSDPAELRVLKTRARKRAERMFAKKLQSERYISLYEKLLNSKATSSQPAVGD